MPDIPKFANDQEESEFWDTHDFTYYLDETMPADVKFVDARPRKTQISLRLDAETIARLGWAGTPEDLLRGSFEFLLRRENKESILPSFTIDVIGRYFPEWEAAARRGF